MTQHHDKVHAGYRHQILSSAKAMRRQPTRAEAMLWERLKGSALGRKFRRQHPLGTYIADFCCVDAHLVVELDGPGHLEQRESDEARSAAIARRGYRLIRFPNQAVLTDIEGVLAAIRAALQPRPGVHIPSPCRPDGRRAAAVG
jgi:very-short-patch-repair endonuclease